MNVVTDLSTTARDTETVQRSVGTGLMEGSRGGSVSGGKRESARGRGKERSRVRGAMRTITMIVMTIGGDLPGGRGREVVRVVLGEACCPR
jgi:hypothetical protein